MQQVGGHPVGHGQVAQVAVGLAGDFAEILNGAVFLEGGGQDLSLIHILPVYMAIAGQDVAKQLLLYRWLQLDGAYHNARQQGLKGALYPMVTFTGVECHNEWEITFEEIHRNGAIAHAIFNYATYTGDMDYMPVSYTHLCVSPS